MGRGGRHVKHPATVVSPAAAGRLLATHAEADVAYAERLQLRQHLGQTLVVQLLVGVDEIGRAHV